MRSPLKRYDSYFKLTEEYQIQNESLKVIDSFYEDVVNKKRNNNNNNSNQTSRSHLAFLDLLLQYEDGSTLTAKDIKDEINTFMFGVSRTYILLIICIIYYHQNRCIIIFDCNIGTLIAEYIILTVFSLNNLWKALKKFNSEIYS